jgi:hypothetical protein
MLTPEQRSQRARVAALSQHAAGRTNVGPAHAAARDRYRRLVLEQAAERGEELSEREIQRRAECLRKLHFARMTYRSLKARAARKTKSSGRATTPELSEVDGGTGTAKAP